LDNKLKTEFEPIAQTDMLRILLGKRKQLDDEQTTSYINDAESLCKRVDSLMPQPEMIRNIIKGLKTTIARCAELHQKQVYLFPTGGIVAGLKVNRTIMATHTLIGTLDREGNCQGASYSSDRGTWKNVVVQGHYKIYLGEGIANTQTKDNILIMPTGTRLKLSELYGLDTHRGEVIWSNDQILQNCDRTDFDVLYDGPASVIIAEKLNLSGHEIHTYMVESET